MTRDIQDDKLVQLLKSGDRKAVSCFVDTHGQFIYHVCYRILLEVTEAEEAAQDAIMKVLKAIENFEATSSLRSWAYTIAYRTAIDYKRRRKYTVDLDQSKSIFYDDEADKRLGDEENNQNLMMLLRHLDDEPRMIISLFYLEEKNIKEVVTIMGLTESNVKIKLFRARKELAKYAERYFEKI